MGCCNSRTGLPSGGQTKKSGSDTARAPGFAEDMGEIGMQFRGVKHNRQISARTAVEKLLHQPLPKKKQKAPPTAPRPSLTVLDEPEVSALTALQSNRATYLAPEREYSEMNYDDVNTDVDLLCEYADAEVHHVTPDLEDAIVPDETYADRKLAGSDTSDTSTAPEVDGDYENLHMVGKRTWEPGDAVPGEQAVSELVLEPPDASHLLSAGEATSRIPSNTDPTAYEYVNLPSDGYTSSGSTITESPMTNIDSVWIDSGHEYVNTGRGSESSNATVSTLSSNGSGAEYINLRPNHGGGIHCIPPTVEEETNSVTAQSKDDWTYDRMDHAVPALMDADNPEMIANQDYIKFNNSEDSDQDDVDAPQLPPKLSQIVSSNGYTIIREDGQYDVVEVDPGAIDSVRTGRTGKSRPTSVLLTDGGISGRGVSESDKVDMDFRDRLMEDSFIHHSDAQEAEQLLVTADMAKPGMFVFYRSNPDAAWGVVLAVLANKKAVVHVPILVSNDSEDGGTPAVWVREAPKVRFATLKLLVEHFRHKRGPLPRKLTSSIDTSSG